MDGYVSSKEALKISKVSSDTLRRWVKEGRIRAVKTKTNRYQYHKRDLLEHTGIDIFDKKKEGREKVCYCRVSSLKQLDDMERQKLYLKERYPNHRIITDVGSGINWKRKGLQAILELSFNRELEEVVVAHKDRLSRIAFDLIEWIIKKNGGKVFVINRSEERTSEQELAEDLLSITTIYSCRQMGRRRYKNKENKVEAEQKPEGDVQGVV